MSRRYKRRKQKLEEVNLNMAAMLDMAFQLLTFFILTFKPTTIEQQIALKLPPPEAIKSKDASANTKKSDAVEVQLKTLQVAADAQPDGGLAGLSFIETGERARNLDDFEAKMRRMLNPAGGTESYEQVIIEVDPRLELQQVMLIIDRCLRQKLADGKQLTKISPILRKEGAK
jgi:biopolymer transport protein ExbD